MKKYAKILVLVVIAAYLYTASACTSSRGCSAMKYYYSDKKRGLAH